MTHPLRIAVPIRIVNQSGAPVSGQVASFFWVDETGQIATPLGCNVPVQDGVALYTGQRLKPGLFWAITVHAPYGLPVFRSGPLAELPGPLDPIRPTPSISILRRSDDGVAFGLNAPDGLPELLREELQKLPAPLRFVSVQLSADDHGHVIVHLEGRIEPPSLTFTYTLPVTLRPASEPGRPQEIIIVKPGVGSATGAAHLDATQLSALDDRIVAGVKRSLGGAIKNIAGFEMLRLGLDFPASLVSVTSVLPTALGNLSVIPHAGAITGDIGPIHE